jgi:hypothetical protein
LSHFDIDYPFAVVGNRVDAQADNLAVALSKLGFEPGHASQLGRAHGCEVSGMRKQDCPPIADPFVKANNAPSGLGRKVWCIDEFDFSPQSTLRMALLGSYLGPELVSEGRSLILHGKTGRGKTHLAVTIGYRAIQNGFETLFTTAAELIEDLSNASRKGRLQEALVTYTHPHVLVIDEVGYLTYAQDAANVLFHVVNNRHLRKRPMIFPPTSP